MVWSAVPWMWITEIGAGDGQGPSMVISIGARPPWGNRRSDRYAGSSASPSRGLGSTRWGSGCTTGSNPATAPDASPPAGRRPGSGQRAWAGSLRPVPRPPRDALPADRIDQGAARAARQHPGCMQLLLPAQPEEIADGVRLLIGPPSADRLPDLVDLEIVRIGLRARTIQVEGKPKVLPPAVVSLASTRP